MLGQLGEPIVPKKVYGAHLPPSRRPYALLFPPSNCAAAASLPTILTKNFHAIKHPTPPYRRTNMSRIGADVTAHDAPRPATEDESRHPNEARLIKFARFVNGILELFEAKTNELEYIAFSHVWGSWEWRRIPGIPYEVKASQEKAEFIANDLPVLVGDGAFWMDTLTVDQRDDNEILAVVDSIPTIFKMAKRTIAVRERDGFL